MNIEDFESIMRNDFIGGELLREAGCSALKGLLVINKYLPLAGIAAANHDIIYSCGVGELVDSGITTEDAIYLRKHNWMIQDDSMACFV